MIPRRSSPEDRIISTRNLRFVYEGGVEALKSINLDIRSGEFLAIVGGNGSGKTTLAKNLNGLLRPTGGSVAVAGKPASDLTVASLSRVVGYAFQNPDHQLFCATVEEELAFGPANLGLSPQQVVERVERAVTAMKLERVRKINPHSLGLSDRRRVSIASIIAMDPQVLVLDEPSTGLDAGETRSLMENILRLNLDGRTIILITHDMRLVAEYAARVIVMSSGRIILDSDPRGAFTDLDVLRNCGLVPPPVTMLAHRLSKFGVPKDVLSPQELALQVAQKRGTSK